MTAINVPVLALRMDAAMAKLCMFRTKKVLNISVWQMLFVERIL